MKSKGRRKVRPLRAGAWAGRVAQRGQKGLVMTAATPTAQRRGPPHRICDHNRTRGALGVSPGSLG